MIIKKKPQIFPFKTPWCSDGCWPEGGGAEAFLRVAMEVDLWRRVRGEGPLILYRPRSDSVHSQYAEEERKTTQTQSQHCMKCEFGRTRKYLIGQSDSSEEFKTTGTQQPSGALRERNASVLLWHHWLVVLARCWNKSAVFGRFAAGSGLLLIRNLEAVPIPHDWLAFFALFSNKILTSFSKR